ncbi:signal transduction histidine kinase [Kribbella steppae]|uniref:histidine kinase n=1 Tax=Kribbella steppae TaxID=2512223 RepID=A0A4R2HX81_9ACTN|nr:histidine kinase [Kribbella steppae]TCO35796.1 signal transduction histidine kinase [Kribbella steppae]
MSRKLGRLTLHGESGWLGRALTSAVAIAVLTTARPAESWAWFVLGGGLAMFMVGTVLMTARPYVALALLGTVAVSNALIAGLPDSNALVLVLVAIADIAVMSFPRYGVLRGNRPIVATGIGVAAAFALSAWWFDRPDSWYFSQLLWTAVLTAFGLNRRQYEIQARQTEQLLEQTRLAQSEQARAAALDERGRIARDLHDVLAHSLGALSVQLELAEALLEERGDTEGALDRIRRSRRLAVQGLSEARNAVAALREDEVPDLRQALAALAEQHEADHGAAVRLSMAGTAGPLDSGATVALLNAAREALTNAARHAPGQPVDVGLAFADGVRLTVRNKGATAGEGFGLAGMRERLALVGGTLTAGPDGDDWLVVAEVPDE